MAILRSQLEIETFEFQPNNPNLIVAGCSNGQLALFSLKKISSLNKKNSPFNKQSKDNNEIFFIEHFLTSSILESFNATQNVNNTDVFSRKQVYLNSHRGKIRNIKFLPKNLELDRKNPLNLVRYEESQSVSGNQFMSLGIDGQLLFWDLRFDSYRDKRTEDKPIEGIIILLIFCLLIEIYFIRIKL